MSRRSETRAAAPCRTPLRAARLAIAAGADSITAHLREDRRHIRDEDMRAPQTRNHEAFEFRDGRDRRDGLNRARHAAARVLPGAEKRSERTTEGGLDVLTGHDHLKLVTTELTRAKVVVALFIEPSLEALEAARSIGAPAIELHTGSWCDALEHGETDRAEAEFVRLKAAAARCQVLGIECHAGHGLDYDTARRISALPQVVELNIGHFLIGEAIFVGLEAAITKIRAAMDAGRAAAAQGLSA